MMPKLYRQDIMIHHSKSVLVLLMTIVGDLLSVYCLDVTTKKQIQIKKTTISHRKMSAFNALYTPTVLTPLS